MLHNTKQIHLITLVRNLHNFLCNTTVGMGGSKSKYQRMVDEDVDAEVNTYGKISLFEALSPLSNFNSQLRAKQTQLVPWAILPWRWGWVT